MATDTTGWSRKEVLDRRAGYITGVLAYTKSIGYTVTLATAEFYAKEEYPMPKVEVPNVVEAKDAYGVTLKFRVTSAGDVEYRGVGTWWKLEKGDYSTLTPSELRAVAEVKERPTITREVE
jgi:hypothetical protein